MERSRKKIFKNKGRVRGRGGGEGGREGSVVDLQ